MFQQVAVQCEDAASVLLPDTGLIQRRIERKPELARRTVDKFSDPLDFEF